MLYEKFLSCNHVIAFVIANLGENLNNPRSRGVGVFIVSCNPAGSFRRETIWLYLIP